MNKEILYKYKNKINKLEKDNVNLKNKIEFLKSLINVLCFCSKIDDVDINIDFDIDF